MAILCGVGGSLPSACAALITIDITATVDSVTDDGPGDGYLDGLISPGSIITGSYTYDSSTADSSPGDPIQGNYWHYSPPAGISLSVGGFDFQADSTNLEFHMFTRNNTTSGNDIYGCGSHNNLSLSNGTSVDNIWWTLKDYAGTALSTDALPTTPPTLNQWEENVLTLETDRAFMIQAHVTSAIPEPTTISLLAIGTMILRKRNPTIG